MQFFDKKFLVSLCMIISMFTIVVAQEKKFSFTWLDASEKKLAGTLNVSLAPSNGDGLYQIHFVVTWFDTNGNPILDVNRMPLLYLSKYDFDMLPSQFVRCSYFEQKKPQPLIFPSSGKLSFQVLGGYQGEVSLVARFQYALSKELYESGKSELIDINGKNSLKIEFPVRSGRVAEDTDVAGNATKTVQPAGYDAAFLRSVAGSYKRTLTRVREFEDFKPAEGVDRKDYLEELELLSAGIEYEKSLLNSDSLPADTFQLYRENYNRLSEAVLDLRTDYLKFSMNRSGLASGSDPGKRLEQNDSLRLLVRNRLEPVFKDLADSLEKLSDRHQSAALELSTIMADPGINLEKNSAAATLISIHDSVKQVFPSLRLAHETAWKNYRDDIDLLMPVREIEVLHNSIVDGQNDLQSAIDQVDRALAVVRAREPESPWYLSNRLVWLGLLIVLILVFVSAIWSTSRSRKILKERLTVLENGNPGFNLFKARTAGILEDKVPAEYFTTDFQETIPESGIGKVHYHVSSIKSVYHLIQGALLEKKGGEFGGYLFGNQYKLPGKGTYKTEVFIEKACDSKYLRSTISNDINARADLVDELDELVRQNKKYRLIGWFTSSVDNTMEIPEGLMKIHRSFFKEKWHIGILLNPASDVLQGAGFMKGKSGYLDPLPDPAAFLKWDELYRFALNPQNTNNANAESPELNGREYSRTALNNTWGDSIVAAVNFDQAVVGEITAAAANQAIPKDTYSVVGYLYGTVRTLPAADGKVSEFEVFIDRFIELSNETAPRDLPGFTLIGWWGQASVDVIHYLQDAVDFHEQSFREPHHISCLVNPTTGELRIFTRKHSLEMNNSTIETEEYSIKSLLSR
jgi:hypothetical protein